MATLKDVASELGISVSTASRALSGHPHVNGATRDRVRAVASQLDYRPNGLARALRRNQSMTVGLVIPDILNEFYSAGAAVLQTILEQREYRLVLCVSKNDPNTDRRCLAALVEQRVDGIIHVPCTISGARYVRETSQHIPIVELNRHSGGGLFDAVVPDERDGALKVTSYLLELGHRRIAMIAGPLSFSTTVERLSGFRAAFLQGGLKVDDSLILHGDYTDAWGLRATNALLALSPRPTAIFASGNRLVLGALKALAEAGRTIPEDISLAGIANPDWYEVCRPRITTYALPLKEMGMLAAQVLLARMTEERDHRFTPTLTRLSGQLIVRESCAAPSQMAPAAERS